MTKTKKDNFNELRTIVENLADPQYDGLLEFIDKEIVALDNKAEQAKKRAAKKREGSNELKEKILALITDIPKSGEFLVGELQEMGEEGISKSKVVSRVTTLIKEGKVQKQVVKEDKRSITVYTLATNADIETEDSEEEE